MEQVAEVWVGSMLVIGSMTCAVVVLAVVCAVLWVRARRLRHALETRERFDPFEAWKPMPSAPEEGRIEPRDDDLVVEYSSIGESTTHGWGRTTTRGRT